MMKVISFVVPLMLLAICERAECLSITDLSAYKEIQQKCITETKVSADEAKQINESKAVANPTQAYKCYQNCLYKKYGLVDAAGKPNSEMILKYLQMRSIPVTIDKAKKLLDSCSADYRGDTECDKVYNMEMCLQKGLKA